MSENDTTWQQPIPLFHMGSSQSEYPIDALPNSIQNAIRSYHSYGQQPMSLLACSALSNISLASQGLADVARDKVLVSPTSIYTIVVSPSGSRKSAADNTFSRPIREWEEATIAKMMPEYLTAKSELATWSIKARALASQINSIVTRGLDSDNAENQYSIHLLQQPDVPILPCLTYEDITPEALTKSLHEKWASSSLWSDEAGIVLSSPGMKNDSTKFLALLNRLWEGKSIIINRKSSKDVLVRNRRFTLSLMMQPLLLQQLLSKSDGVSRQSGFLARTLMACPESTMGTRFYKEPHDMSFSMEAYSDRIKDCLENTLPVDKHGFADIPVLTFSNSAKKEWVSMFNHIESSLADPFVWQPISDLASKAAENIARLSALFHLYEGEAGYSISKENIERAYEIMVWHLNESKRIFGATEHSQVEHDANKIMDWVREKSLRQTTPRDIMQRSPIRDKSRRNSALKLLERTHHIQTTTGSNGAIILINPRSI